MYAMSGFQQLTGKIVVLPEDHIDTDRIIPARFLSMVTKSGYGDLLFHDVRNEAFPLDQPEAKGAQILVAGTNFGCGSSREHAVWALQQAGFSVIISKTTDSSPGYSDIFRQNAANCGLLLIELKEDQQTEFVKAGTGAVVTVNLPEQTVTVGSHTFSFDINPANKNQILKGLDMIGTSLEFKDAISEYESKAGTYVPLANV